MPITIINEELRTALGKDLDTISAKLPEGKDFVLVLKDEHIPKSRFDEVNTTAKDYKAKYEGVNAELEKLKPLAGNSEALNAEIKKLQDLNKSTITDYEAKIQTRDRDYALNDTIREFKPRNLKAVSALLDSTKIEYKDGTLKGAKEQLEALKKSDPYLFNEEDNQTPPPWAAGTKPGTQPIFSEVDPMAKYFGLKQTPKK